MIDDCLIRKNKSEPMLLLLISYLDINYNFISMNIIRNSLKSIIQTIPKYNFSQNTWKDREESAEKVYISQEQKKTLSKLLHKIEENEINSEQKEQEFHRQLKDALKRHNINNEAFYAEVINLHKSL